MESDKKDWTLGEVALLPRQTSQINKKYEYLITSRYICIRETSEGQRGILLKVLGKTAREDIIMQGANHSARMTNSKAYTQTHITASVSHL